MDIDLTDVFIFILKLAAAVFLGSCVIVVFPAVFLLSGSSQRPHKRPRSPILIAVIVLASLFAGLFLVQFLGDFLFTR